MVKKNFYLKLLMSLMLVALAVPQGKADEVTVAEDGTSQKKPIPIEGTYFDTQGAYGQIIYNKND